eukprot:3096507-Rhodomonas_salina.2
MQRTRGLAIPQEPELRVGVLEHDLSPEREGARPKLLQVVEVGQHQLLVLVSAAQSRASASLRSSLKRGVFSVGIVCGSLVGNASEGMLGACEDGKEQDVTSCPELDPNRQSPKSKPLIRQASNLPSEP